MNNVTITLLDEEMTKIKVVDLAGFYNFVVDHIFNWNHFLFKNSVPSSQTLKFKFHIVQKEPDGEMTKIKVVDLDELYNFVVDDFFS
jgi:hypothetical protein